MVVPLAPAATQYHETLAQPSEPPWGSGRGEGASPEPVPSNWLNKAQPGESPAGRYLGRRQELCLPSCQGWREAPGGRALTW